MMRNFTICVFIAGLLTLGGCKKDKAEEREPDPVYTGKITLVSTTLQDDFQWEGGEVDLKVEVDNATGKWQGRLLINEKAGETIDFDGKEVKISIPQNRTEHIAVISIEAFSEETWTELAKGTQMPGSIKIGEYVWAKGNLAAHNSEFVFVSETDYGMYFNQMSHYAIPGGSELFAGVAYTPEKTTINWESIPSRTGKDPCRLVKPENTWQTPDWSAFEDLMDKVGDFALHKNVMGQIFDNGNLFLPAAGTRLKEDGKLAALTTNGGYWGRGADKKEFGEMLIISSDYAMIYYNLIGNLGTIRCVKMEGLADLVSFTPAEGGSEGFELTVTASGTKEKFNIAINDGDALSLEEEVTNTNPVAKFTIPANKNIEPRKINISVDNTFTGQYVTQAGISNYIFYDSHSPAGPVSGDAFDLSVKCISDMSSFEVVVYTDDNSVTVTKTGNKDNLTVVLPIPSNHTGSTRTLKIKVNGQDTDKTVKQEYRPEEYGEVSLANVTWARGNLVLKNGAFEVGEPNEYGLYFMRNSLYGIASDKENYEGKVYSPSPLSMAWSEIPYNNENDPCKLINPANTWRTPSESELEGLHKTAGSLYTLNGIKGRHYAGNNMFVPASGMIQNEKRTPQGTYGYLRSTSQKIISYSEQAGFGNGLDNFGYPVRCVKRKNFAEYVSHSPVGDQPGDAFVLTVTCESDLATFPVRVFGGDVDITKTGSSSSPVVTFDIPINNKPSERELAIYINGMDTDIRIKHASKQGLSVEWSPGYLTVKDGDYAFAPTEEIGMFFKYNSQYGVPKNATYQGKAYGPQETTYSNYKDIPYNEIDPCSLMSPKGVWRTASQSNFKELMQNATLTATANYLKYTLGAESVHFAGPSAVLMATGKPTYPDYIYMRTSTLDPAKPTTNTNYFRSKMDTSSATVDASYTMGLGTLIRCVKDK